MSGGEGGKGKGADGTERVMNPNHLGICFRETEINKHKINKSPQHLASRTKSNWKEKAQLLWSEKRKRRHTSAEAERVIFGQGKQ